MADHAEPARKPALAAAESGEARAAHPLARRAAGLLGETARTLNTAPPVVAQRELAAQLSAPAQRVEAPRPNRSGLPNQLKAGIESLSGISMDDVRGRRN